jgi:hypothetical protein
MPLTDFRKAFVALGYGNRIAQELGLPQRGLRSALLE